MDILEQTINAEISESEQREMWAKLNKLSGNKMQNYEWIDNIAESHTDKEFRFNKYKDTKLKDMCNLSDSELMQFKLVFFFFKKGMVYYMSTKRASELLTTAKNEWKSRANSKGVSQYINFRNVGTSLRSIQNNFKKMVEKDLIRKSTMNHNGHKVPTYYPTKFTVVVLNYLFGREILTQKKTLQPAKKQAVENKIVSNTTKTSNTNKTTSKKKLSEKRLPSATLRQMENEVPLKSEAIARVYREVELDENTYYERGTLLGRYMKRTPTEIRNKYRYFRTNILNEKMLENLKPTHYPKYEVERTSGKNVVPLSQMRADIDRLYHKNSHTQKTKETPSFLPQCVKDVVDDVKATETSVSVLERFYGRKKRDEFIRRLMEQAKLGSIDYFMVQSIRDEIKNS